MSAPRRRTAYALDDSSSYDVGVCPHEFHHHKEPQPSQYCIEPYLPGTGSCCRPCPYWRAKWFAEPAGPGYDCVQDDYEGYCCASTEFAYNVGVYELCGQTREDYLNFIHKTPYWRYLPKEGYAHAPREDTIDDWKDPVAAVCTVDPLTDAFPDPKSILAFVVASRLSTYDGTVVALLPMGLTKTQIGFGMDFSYGLDKGQTQHYKRTDPKPVRGRPWARSAAPRMFSELLRTHPHATLMTRIHTPNAPEINGLIKHMAATIMRGRVSLGFKQYIGEQRHRIDWDALKILMEKWFPYENIARLFRTNIRVSQTGTGIELESAPTLQERHEPITNPLQRLTAGQTVKMGSQVHHLDRFDVHMLDIICKPYVVHIDRSGEQAVSPFVSSRLLIDDQLKIVSLEGSWSVSYAGFASPQSILEGLDLHTHMGMLFCIYPESS